MYFSGKGVHCRFVIQYCFQMRFVDKPGVYVRHMTRFDAFFTNLVCKKQREVCRNKRRFIDKPPL